MKNKVIYISNFLKTNAKNKLVEARVKKDNPVLLTNNKRGNVSVELTDEIIKQYVREHL